MRHLEKLWTILFKIDEARAITPKGKPVRIDASRVIWPVISGLDADYMFEKLSDDEKIIKLVSKPATDADDQIRRTHDPEADCYVFEVLPAFDEYFDETYTKYSFGTDKISDGNFLKVFDVVLDVKEELEITDVKRPFFRTGLSKLERIAACGTVLDSS